MKTSTVLPHRFLLDVEGFEPPFHEIGRHFVQPGAIVEVHMSVHPFLTALSTLSPNGFVSFVPYWIERAIPRSDRFAMEQLNLKRLSQGRKEEMFSGWWDRVQDHIHRSGNALLFVSTIAKQERMDFHPSPRFYGVAEGKWQHPSGDIWQSWHYFTPVGSPPLAHFRGFEEPGRLTLFQATFATPDHSEPERVFECVVRHSLNTFL